jgi:choline kinase
LLDSGRPNGILVAGLSGSGDEVYICANDRQEIIELGKNISVRSKQSAIGELAGISRFQRRFLELVFTAAREDFQNGEMNYHYEECVFRTSQKTFPIHAVTATELAWVEIDTAADLQRAQDQIFPLISCKT